MRHGRVTFPFRGSFEARNLPSAIVYDGVRDLAALVPRDGGVMGAELRGWRSFVSPLLLGRGRRYVPEDVFGPARSRQYWLQLQFSMHARSAGVYREPAQSFLPRKPSARC